METTLAGIMNHRLYYDEKYRIIMHIQKDNQIQRLDKIKMKLFSQETVLSLPWFNVMFNATGLHKQSKMFRKVNLRCSQGSFIEEKQSQSLQLVDINEISTEFIVEY